MQSQVPATSIDDFEDLADAQAAPVDLLAIARAALRRWKLIASVTLCSLLATYAVLKVMPALYKSTVEILVYDPQQQIDAAIQKPISPFVDALTDAAMATEIDIVKSKSVALRVADELGLDKDPEFQTGGRFAGLGEFFGGPGPAGGRHNDRGGTIGGTAGERADALDRAADALIRRIQVTQDAYILAVSVTSQSPTKAQRLAEAIAKDYLASQREARQQALQRVANWLKERVDNLQARVLQTESDIEKLKAASGIKNDNDFNNAREQMSGLYTQLMKAREDVGEKSARLEQARHLIDTNGDIQSIPELTDSTTLTQLRQQQMELSSRAADLQTKLGPNHMKVIETLGELTAVNNQINAEAQHILGDMKNAYDIAVRRQQALEASLQGLAAHVNSEAYTKLRQLRRSADADQKLYESYLSQYNDISERATVQDASSRIISPATLPRSTTSSKRKMLLPVGAMFGLGSGFMLACLLEYFRTGIKTGQEVEQSFGRPVMGIIPLVGRRKTNGMPRGRLLGEVVNEPFSQLTEAVHAMRISLELSSANSKVILITSALPAEGKSTVAMLLAASSASSGKKTVLVDCDLRQPSTSEVLQNNHQPGLSDLLLGTARLSDIITKDPITNAYVIPAGSMVPNAPDWLKSERMRDLILELRNGFDYIVMDTSPLLPVVDALVLTTVADKVLVIVEWSRTPRDSIAEAFKVLRPEVHRVAGIVINKADVHQFPGYGYYGSYNYRSVRKHAAIHET